MKNIKHSLLGLFSLLILMTGLGVGSHAYAQSKTVNGITISDVSITQAMRGVSYTYNLSNTTSGPTAGDAPYTYALVSGALPSGFVISSNGIVSGVNCTNVNGNNTFGVRVTSAQGVVANFTGGNSLSIQMTAGPSGTCASTLSLPGASTTWPLNTAYSSAIIATGGNGNYTYSVFSGILPTGLTLNANGSISGTPTVVGTYTFRAQVVDSAGANGVANYTIEITDVGVLSIGPGSMPEGTVGAAYANQTMFAIGGDGAGPYTYEVTAGMLPIDVTLTTGGELSGTPTVAGNYTFTITGTDTTGGATDSVTNTLLISSAIVDIGPATLSGGTSGSSYSQLLTPTGGTGPYTCSITAGALPGGIRLTSNTLIGAPTAAGAYNFTVECVDSFGNSGTTDYSLTITAGNVLTIGPASMPAGTVGATYANQTLTATGGDGVGPYTYAVTAGTLPTGLTLTTGGQLSGTPTAAGTYTFTVKGTDSTGGDFGSKQYTIVVAPPVALTVGPATIAAPEVGMAYSTNLTTTGGTGPYQYTLTGGSLPVGLNMNSAGLITGIPTTPGTYTFTVTSKDIYGAIGTRTYTLVIRVDPTRDESVKQTIAAQLDASGRFAGAQMMNIRDRLREIRQTPEAHEGCSLGLNVSNAGSAEGQSGRIAIESEEACQGVSVWSMGSVTLSDSSLGGSNLQTDGITLGIDRRITDSMVLGATVGYASTGYNLRSVQSELDADQQSFSFYGAYRNDEGIYLDGIIGMGALGFDVRRWSAPDAGYALASRDGDQWYASLLFGYEFRKDTVQYGAYLRYDRTESSLDGYAESGITTNAFDFGGQDVTNDTFAIGFEGSYYGDAFSRYARPFWNIEARNRSQSDSTVSINYLNSPVVNDFILETPGWSDWDALLGVGFDSDLGMRWGLSFMYQNSFNSLMGNDASLGLRLMYRPALLNEVVPGGK
ncbi:putative Ig domain-containing protein [Arenimonas sp.]|jgi:uncharacterized protein YhjY with autotransporter beta-barrel domain|uniref:putative Ig domain-containing protein n=1 Tax=Arenimonas sp. TaxID=1872635 RepID=UPI0037C0AE51